MKLSSSKFYKKNITVMSELVSLCNSFKKSGPSFLGPVDSLQMFKGSKMCKEDLELGILGGEH